jgi:hypothetical protein
VSFFLLKIIKIKFKKKTNFFLKKKKKKKMGVRGLLPSGGASHPLGPGGHPKIHFQGSGG